MLSSANIEHGIMLALIALVSIILLIIAGITALFRLKSKNKSETKDMIIISFALIGVTGLLFSCSG
ncbi:MULTISPECIES: hypothetical protein [Acinetobacter]|uniref:hypothetical protein n=1 Tax=Acinetobacter TaxID=469 RepID=UPI00046E2588|nr:MULTISPECIES: hypothetical protein [Acinetobacter]MDV7668341.1 hypothetical protein [Acinetobacter baumannii]AZC01583.1 hypothetical protein DKC18_000440 [Acinetobacter nosocomialis]AZC03781.1 hypothetical protein DKE50_000445 [Acinetobacter nosocomialis]AZC05485.1 hypothetical protein DKE44_000440 [Acinetobacter nosocomialis]ELA7466064.1 hypothetical protein [Acinetobacter nosocomialis]